MQPLYRVRPGRTLLPTLLLLLGALLGTGACQRQPAEDRAARRQRIATALVRLERAVATAGAEHRALITKTDRAQSAPRLKAAENSAAARLAELRALAIPPEDGDLLRYRDVRVQYIEDSLAYAARVRAFFTEHKQSPDAIEIRERIKKRKTELEQLEAALPELQAARSRLGRRASARRQRPPW